MRVSVEQLLEWRLAGEPKYSEKTCPSATLSTTNPTWPDPGSKSGRRGGKPATNRLSYGGAYHMTYQNLTRDLIKRQRYYPKYLVTKRAGIA
jgi:hypothetical protein